mgnify:CR=1 FL=1
MRQVVNTAKVHLGFTLIELIIVIVLLGVLSAFALPRFVDMSRTARIATIEGVAGAMRSTIHIVKSAAHVQGLQRLTSIPPDQSVNIITTEAGSSEVDWRNLCPESLAEEADDLSMIDHIGLSISSNLNFNVGNQYTRVGYDIQGSGAPTANGCYVTYDSFGLPDCTVTLVLTDC